MIELAQSERREIIDSTRLPSPREKAAQHRESAACWLAVADANEGHSPRLAKLALDLAAQNLAMALALE